MLRALLWTAAGRGTSHVIESSWLLYFLDPDIGEPDRFGRAPQVGAYAGLTARVNQSGSHCYHGHITKQGSRWLRWILVQAAMKIVRKDQKLNNFYTRIRKRSGRNVARVAVARKLAASGAPLL